MSFNPTAISAVQKGDRMVALYATVDGEEVFMGSSLNSAGFEAATKMGWIVDALEAHYGIKAVKPKKAAAATKKAAPKKTAGTKSVASLLPTTKKIVKKGK